MAASASSDGAAPTGRTYGGRSAEERVGARRQALMAAGLELFGTRSFHEVTVADIVKESGLHRSAFYESFQHGEALLRAVHDDIVAGNFELLASAGGGSGSARGVEHFVRAFVGYYAQDMRRARVQFQTVVGVSPAMEELRRVSTRRTAEAIGELVGRSSGMAPATRTRAALLYVGGVSELFMDWLWQPEGTLDELCEEMTVALLRRFDLPDGMR